MVPLVPSVLSKSKINVYSAVTNKIVAAIESGAGEFRLPWHSPRSAASLPVNAATLNAYQGINVLALWLAAQEFQHPTALWASYKQWQSIGAQVKYQARGSLIVFYKRIESTPFDPGDPDQRGELRHVARASWVFNAAQVEGFNPPAPEHKDELARINEAEGFVGAINPTIRHGGEMARYVAATDTIEVPELCRFIGTATRTPIESYYGVLLHELTHWSGAPHRLNRLFGKRFGDEAYAMEELVAELGAAFLCAALGITNEPRPDHAAYLATWLKVLKQDSRAIFTAAHAAQEALEHLCYLAAKNDTGQAIEEKAEDRPPPA